MQGSFHTKRGKGKGEKGYGKGGKVKEK